MTWSGKQFNKERQKTGNHSTDRGRVRLRRHCHTCTAVFNYWNVIVPRQKFNNRFFRRLLVFTGARVVRNHATGSAYLWTYTIETTMTTSIILYVTSLTARKP